MKNIPFLLFCFCALAAYTQNVGVGTTTPSEKLDVAGNVNITGAVKINGSPGTAGQVLVSNGATAPSWQNPGSGVAFNIQAYSGNSIAIPSSTTATHLVWHYYGTADFNDGNGFDNATGNFICPSAGTYYVEAQVAWPNLTAPTGLELRKNGVLLANTQDKLTMSPASYGQSFRITTLVKCAVGDAISVYAYQVSGSTQTINNSAATHFNGFKIY